MRVIKSSSGMHTDTEAAKQKTGGRWTTWGQREGWTHGCLGIIWSLGARGELHIELYVAIEVAAATAILVGEGGAGNITLLQVNLGVLVGGVVGAPAGLGLGDGPGVVIAAKVRAEAVGLVDADICEGLAIWRADLGGRCTGAEGRRATYSCPSRPC